MPEIESETKFFWKILLHILISPITFFQVLFGRKESKELWKPFFDIVEFIFEPKFTISMIILNVVIFIWSVFFASEQLINSFVHYPANIFSAKVYTIITAGFLHADMSHLFFNMVALFIFGRVVERKLGFFKTAMVYFGAMIISHVFASIIYLFVLGENVGGLGASGALMGLVSCAILVDPLYLTYELIVPLPIMIVGWLTIYADITGIISSANDGIGHFAHLGGFISIAILTYFFSDIEKEELKKGLIINVVSFAVIAAIYFVYISGIWKGLF